MRFVFGAFRILHAAIALLFTCASLMLIVMAARLGWSAFAGSWDQRGSQDLIEAVGLLTAAIVALQIAETVAEEEVIREANISGPTRLRRFLSRFFVVVVVALAIEGLVATFKSVHEEIASLGYAAALIAATALLLAAWGLFVYFNRSAEELEPEAMEKVKVEDEKLE